MLEGKEGHSTGGKKGNSHIGSILGDEQAKERYGDD